MSSKLRKNLQECHQLDDQQCTGMSLDESLIVIFEIRKASVETQGVTERFFGGILGTNFNILSYCGSTFFLSTGGNKSFFSGVDDDINEVKSSFLIFITVT